MSYIISTGSFCRGYLVSLMAAASGDVSLHSAMETNNVSERPFLESIIGLSAPAAGGLALVVSSCSTRSVNFSTRLANLSVVEVTAAATMAVVLALTGTRYVSSSIIAVTAESTSVGVFCFTPLVGHPVGLGMPTSPWLRH